MNEKKLTVLLCTSDSYDDLWNPFFTLYNLYFENKDIPIIMNTESKNYSFPNLNIKTLNLYNKDDNIPYGKRMKEHIRQINSPYTLLLLDDFFLRKNVDLEKINELISFMDTNPRTATINFDDAERGGYDDSKLPGFLKLPKYANYKLNMQAAIWRTDKLFEYWDEQDSPWLWEIYGNYQSFNDEDDFYHIADSSLSPIDYGYNPQGMGVFRGKWVEEDVVPLFQKHNISVDFNKRGFYDPSKTTNLFNNKYSTMKYMFHRIGFKNTFNILKFKGLKKLGFYKSYGNYVQLLFEKHSDK